MKGQESNSLLSQIKISLNESIAESPKMVILKDKIIPNGQMICPHCNEEILEKSIASRILEGNAMRHWHGKCGGEIELPPPTPEAQSWLDDLTGKNSKFV